MYVNKTTILGNLTKDPELKSLPSGIKVCGFSVATNRTYKGKDGQKETQVEYHNCVAFGKTAELIAQYMKKGSQIFVEGRLQTRSWEADGVKKYRTEIVVEQMQFGNKPKGDSPAEKKPSAKSDEIEYPAEEVNADDIPF